MKHISHFKFFFLFLIATVPVSCRQGYRVSGTNRHTYTINHELPADSAIVRKYLPYRQQVEAQMNLVIGQSARELIKNDDLPETTLGNFFADAVLAEAKKLGHSIDFAIPTTKGGMRRNLPEGDIRMGNIFELMPFENELVLLKVKGADVEKLLQFIAQTGGQPVAGMRMDIAGQKPENVRINGEPFDQEKVYHILTSDYLAGGGDYIQGLKNPMEKTVLGLKLRDALINHIKTSSAAGKPIDAQLDGRITKN